MSDPIMLESVQRLDVKPGETVVLKLAAEPTEQEAQRITEQLRRAIPDGAKLLLLGPGMEISVVAEAPE